jgi:hypothetical protein
VGGFGLVAAALGRPGARFGLLSSVASLGLAGLYRAVFLLPRKNHYHPDSDKTINIHLIIFLYLAIESF